jgi:hypothetical protein
MAKSTYSQDSVNALANQHLRVCNSVAELPDYDWTADDGSPSVVYNGAEYPATTDIYEGWLYSFVAYVTDTETFGGGIITKIDGEIKVITGEKPALLRKQILNIGDVSYEVVEGVTIDIGFTTFGSLFGETITLPAGSTIVYRPGLTDEIVLTLNEKIETVEGAFTANVTPNRSGTVVRLGVAYGHRILLANDTIPAVPTGLRPLSDISQTSGAGNGTVMSYFNLRIFLQQIAKNYIAYDDDAIIEFLNNGGTQTIVPLRFPSGVEVMSSSDNSLLLMWTGVSVIAAIQSNTVSSYIYIPNESKGGTIEQIFTHTAAGSVPSGVNIHTYASDEDFVKDSKTLAQYFVDYGDLFEAKDLSPWTVNRYGEFVLIDGGTIEAYAPPNDPTELAPYNDPAMMNIVCWK